MKKIFTLSLLLYSVLLFSCKGSKSSYRNDQKDLSMLIKRLTKRGSDDKVLEDIRSVYFPALQKAQQNISSYRYDPVPEKWGKIIPQMEAMQKMYDIINTNAYAVRMIQPVNFYRNIKEAKDSAASDYYDYGNRYFEKDGRENSKLAFTAFKVANEYSPNYKDARTKMQEAFDRSIVHVLVNPLQYNGFGFNNNWNWNNYSNRDQQFQYQLMNDLGGRRNNNIPARFYTEWDLRRENRAPDLVVDLVWQNMRFDQPMDRTTSYNRSRQIETGKDTANRPIYQTVNATVFVTERQLNADADLNIIITDAVNRRQVEWQNLPSNYRYSFEYATYQGDRRALDDNDWNLINRTNNQQMPTREDALQEMMRRIYSDVVYRIRRAANW